MILEDLQPQLRLLRTHEYLDAAPALVGHIVQQITPTMQTREDDGSQRTKASFGRLPLHDTPVDDADELYARLANWTTDFARALGVHPPVHLLRGYALDQNVDGLPAHAIRIPDHAFLLTRTVADWLQDHEHQIAATSSSAVTAYETDVHEAVASMRGRYPDAPTPPRRYFARPCELCGEKQVRIHWTDVPIGPQVIMLRCRNCYHRISGAAGLTTFLNSAW